MGPGHPAGHAYFAQRGPRGHVLSGLHVDRAQMAIHADHAAAVIHKDRLAIEKLITRVDHRTRERRPHRRADRCGDVHAAVWIARLAVENAAHAE